MNRENKKSVNGSKRDALNAIIGAARMLQTININRDDANIDLFKSIVAQLACSANEIFIIARTIDSKQEV